MPPSTKVRCSSRGLTTSKSSAILRALQRFSSMLNSRSSFRSAGIFGKIKVWNSAAIKPEDLDTIGAEAWTGEGAKKDRGLVVLGVPVGQSICAEGVGTPFVIFCTGENEKIQPRQGPRAEDVSLIELREPIISQHLLCRRGPRHQCPARGVGPSETKRMLRQRCTQALHSTGGSMLQPSDL